MLQIAHLDTGSDLRGGQQQLLMLARGLRERGHEQLIVTMEGAALEAFARKEGFRVFALPSYDPGHAHGILQLRQLWRAEPFQILHAHDGKAQTLSWLASVGMNARRVASRRVMFLPARRLDSQLKYGHTCHAVIAVSKFVGQLLVASGVPQRQIEVIPDGVEFPETLPDVEARTRMRAKWSCGSQEFIVGHLSAPSREKGQDIAWEASNLLQETVPEARLVLAMALPGAHLDAVLPVNFLDVSGSPSRQARVKHIGGTAPRYVLPESLSDFFAALDLYIMPSRAEGLGSSALLAMAYGLPVVASRVGGLPEIVEDGVTGWLVEPGSPKALADAIARAAADRAHLREMGAIARERARRFSSTIMVDRTEALYEKLNH